MAHPTLSALEAFITTLYSADQIEQRCAELGAEITRDFADSNLLVIGVLKGVFPFFADLVRHIKLPCRCDFLGLSSYGSRTESSGVVRVTSDLSSPVQNLDVLVVEDIVDTGLTMRYLIDTLKVRNPNSVHVCTLLHKPSNQRLEVPLDYTGFTVDDHFVVGYGLDYDERFRNLPYIGHFAGDIPKLEG